MEYVTIRARRHASRAPSNASREPAAIGRKD